MNPIVRRLLLVLPTLLGVATLVFFFIHLLPGDPVDAMLGEHAAAVDRAALRAALGLDRPLWSQYARFLSGLAHGDLGLVGAEDRQQREQAGPQPRPRLL